MSRKKQWDRSPKFLTAWQFAELLNVCEESVYRAHQRGDLEAVRVGRSIRFPVSQLSHQKEQPWVSRTAARHRKSSVPVT